MKLRLLACGLLSALLGASASGCADARPPQVRDGDVIFHVSRSSQSQAIQRATGSRYSHMGVILHRDGQPYVFEAIDPVTYTPLQRWIARGSGGHYVLKRLRTPLTAQQATKLRGAAEAFRGRRYDLAFEWSDQRIYCSELVWKMYDRALGVRIGTLQPLRSFKLDDPAVKAKLRERYGERVPLAEPVISPAAMFDSPLLTTVASG
ncbi:YiiX family permuted papain-like enzyme [Lysobacter antibioticus]|uniref:YiiX family permuted papain-like enzyme n=1 Tax=Lysobacter TaxID=68 RepID=UPI0004D028F6|nr:YiiX family permuted papain-like enzyme [Lysobacter antibioticus]